MLAQTLSGTTLLELAVTGQMSSRGGMMSAWGQSRTLGLDRERSEKGQKRKPKAGRVKLKRNQNRHPGRSLDKRPDAVNPSQIRVGLILVRCFASARECACSIEGGPSCRIFREENSSRRAVRRLRRWRPSVPPD